MDYGWPEWHQAMPVIRGLMAGMRPQKPYPRALHYSVMRSSVDALGIRFYIAVDPNFSREFRYHKDWRRRLSSCLHPRNEQIKWPRPETRPTACRFAVATGEGPVVVIRAEKIAPYALVV